MIRWPRRKYDHATRPAWSTYRPDKFRLALAFLAAPVAASTIFVVAFLLVDLFRGSSGGADFAGLFLFLFGWSFSISVILSVILGVPLYALLIGKVRPRLGNVVLGGVCIGAVGVVSLRAHTLPTLPMLPGMLAGAAGGAAFWFCAVWRDPVLQFATSAAGEASRRDAADFRNVQRKWRKAAVVFFLIGSIVLFFSIIGVVLPSIGLIGWLVVHGE